MRYLSWVCLGVISLYPAVRGNFTSSLYRVITFLLFFVFMVCGARVLEYLLGRITHWRLLTPDRYRGILCRHCVTLTDDALIEVTAINEERCSWHGVHHVVHTPEYIYIFATLQSAHIIPKRAFPDPDVAQQFYERAARLCDGARMAEERPE